ncbi:smith-Magenis syndrome chromosomal region candidate 8 [Elysia marginata]|uniref:Smith-Magenis syndrome chromosomal region candidate 8 n=1 Tax=Elysia marginata TaxID=1093978 RepID=A0AAV4JI52_9GAST|nr:smith-Magenis syndrome chromosomal region candidate 8 [Elysia marginata]
MFGEYAQIATYVQSSPESLIQNDPYGSERMPSYLRPSVLPPQPWAQKKEKLSGLGEDFIMVAEFSELEGPKPVMTIPKDGGSSFDQNTFSVKILAVDHQHATEGFTITEDAQVVYSDLELGVFAFVHHLVLFDNTARGFVRPYCIAYITSQQRKIMSFYEEISWQMKKAARYLKYGNRMVFVGDLERHLKDLDHTKGFLLNQVSKMRLKDSDSGDGQEIRKNAEAELYKGLQTIRQSSMEIKEILSILKPLLSDRRLEARFKVLEERAFQHPSTLGADNLSLQENWYNDLSTLNGLDTRCGSLNEPRLSPLTLFKPKEYKPHLVETKKAKRFNSALRGLHELCSWGAKEGLKKLRSFYEYCKRDIMLLTIERNESQMKYPGFSTVCHADCMTGNFISGMYMNGPQIATDYYMEDWSSMSRDIMRSGGSMGSFDSLESFKSADSQSLSLAMRDGSPSSTRTADSFAHNKFESAQSSPKAADFSLLMENEYYSDVDSSHNDKTIQSANSNRSSSGGSSDKSSRSETNAQPSTYPSGRRFDDLNTSGRALPNLNPSSNPLKASKHSNSSLSSLGQKSLFTPGSWPLTFTSKSRPRTIAGSKAILAAQSDRKISIDESFHFNENRETNVEGFLGSNSKAATDFCHTSEGNITPRPHFSDEPAIKTDVAKLVSTNDEVSSSNCKDLHDKQEENQEGLSKLFVEDSIESINLSTDTFRASPFRPHAPFPGLEDSTEEQQIKNEDNASAEVDTCSKSENLALNESNLTVDDLGMTQQLGSVHTTKVRADSEVSSVFTEVSTRELYSHLMGPEILSSSYKDSSSSHNDVLDDRDPNDEYVDIPAVVCDVWKPRCGLLSVGDWINNMSHSRPGYCLLEVLTTYHHMQHVIASLLTGRPVLIAGSAKFEGEVCRLVTALSVFVGAVRRKRQHAVLDWTSKPPQVPDLTKLRLVGVCRPDRRKLESFIPSAVRQICTVMDVEKKIIVAPPYQGHFINTLLSKKKAFKTDAQLLAYIHWWLMDVMSKTFIFYHSFCMGSSGSIIYSQSAKDQRDSYCGAVSAIMAKLGVKDSDCDIVEHLTELTKLSQIEQKCGSLGINTGFGITPLPLHLHHKVCQTFRC